VAKTVPGSGETRRGENSITRARQRLVARIRFVIDKTVLLQADNHQGDGRKTPLEPICAAASVQPLEEAPLWDSEIPDGFSPMAARRKAIWVAWDEPSVSWCKPIKVQK
jgi:hypothetical protein